MTAPTPPEPLPPSWLALRKHGERKFEFKDQAGDEKLREIQVWAKHMMTQVIVAQTHGANEDDEQFMDFVDAMYNTIRDSLTRQDLLRGFLLNVLEDAERDAVEVNLDFEAELNMMMPGGVIERRDQKE